MPTNRTPDNEDVDLVERIIFAGANYPFQYDVLAYVPTLKEPRAVSLVDGFFDNSEV